MRLNKLIALVLVVAAWPLAASAQNISTVAGGGATNVQTLSASIGGPAAIAKDSLGNTYILDSFLSRILKVDTTGNLTIFCGNSTNGYGGDNGPAAAAVLNGPRGLFIDSHDNLFIADADNGIIREIPAASGTNYGIGMTGGDIYTVAGMPQSLNYSGDGGPATKAELFFPDGVWVDPNGDIFIADKGNHVVREVAATSATNFGILMVADNIYTIAGIHNSLGFSGDGGLAISAQLNNPWSVGGDSHGNIFIGDSTNSAVREVTAADGKIQTVAGMPPNGGSTGPSSGVAATSVLLGVDVKKEGVPLGVYLDAHDNLFISDSSNHAIREVPSTTANGMTAGFIYTIAGQIGVNSGPNGDGGAATSGVLHNPSDVWIDASGDLFIADTNGGAVREVPAVSVVGPPAMTANDIYTVDGNGHSFFGGDGGPATNAELAYVSGVASDANNNIFIADTQSHAIRKLTVANGIIQTVVGTGGSDGYGANGTVATATRLEAPNNIFVDKAGNIFIADTGNHVVREVPLKTGNNYGIAMTGGSIYTIAGSAPTLVGNPPVIVVHPGYNGDNVPATSAQLNTPEGVFVDSNGNILIADTMNHAIREVAATTTATMTKGFIYTVAGTPTKLGSTGDGGPATSAKLNQPWSVFVDAFGNLFIADSNNHTIREVPALTSSTMTAGDIYTIAGTATKSGFSGDGALATSAKLNTPVGVAVDPAGDVFISDANQVIREVTTDGNINTVAGTPKTGGFTGDTGPANKAELNTPQGIALDSNGNLLIADSQNVRIRSVAGLATNNGLNLAPLSLTFPQVAVGFPSGTQTVFLNNTGATTLSITVGFATTGNPGDFAQTNTCASVAANAQCTISVTFKPTALGPRSATITLADSAVGSPTAISLSGTGAPDIATAVLTPSTLTFTTPQIVGQASPSQPVTLSNTGTAPLTLAISFTGTNPADFTETDNCGASLAVGAPACTINVAFNPTATGSRKAVLTITDNASGSPHKVTLSGTAVAPAVTLNPSTGLTFADQMVGTSSIQQTVTLTNSTTTSTPLTISSITITGTNPGDFTPAYTCSTTQTLAPNANCTISVTFTPTASGARSATVSIADNAPGNPHTISLSGNGTALSLAPSTGSNSQTVKAGATATYNLQLSATGGTTPVNVTVTCSGAPPLGVCNAPSSPVVVTPGATAASFQITVNTKGLPAVMVLGPQSAPRMEPPAGIRALPFAALSLLLFIAALLAAMRSSAGRMRTVRMAFAAYLILMPLTTVALLTGCGGGSSSVITPPPPPATAPSITTQPTDQTVAAGQTATFTVAASGTAPLTYQWQKNGSAINGATSASYTTPAATSADNGASFVAVVSNSAGNATSNAAKLNVPPTTPTGTYTLTVTATANGVSQNTPLTLIVQ